MPVASRRVFLSLLGLLAVPGLAFGGEFILQPIEVAETKALEQEPMLNPVDGVTGSGCPIKRTPWAWW